MEELIDQGCFPWSTRDKVRLIRFTMSSNSGVMVMLIEAVSVLGVGRKEPSNLMRKRDADRSGPGAA